MLANQADRLRILAAPDGGGTFGNSGSHNLSNEWDVRETEMLNEALTALHNALQGHPQGDRILAELKKYPIRKFGERYQGTPEETAAGTWDPDEKCFRLSESLVNKPITVCCVLIHEGWHAHVGHPKDVGLHLRLTHEIETHETAANVISECFLQPLQADDGRSQLYGNVLRFQIESQELGKARYIMARDVFGEIANLCAHQGGQDLGDFPRLTEPRLPMSSQEMMRLGKLIQDSHAMLMRVICLSDDRSYGAFFDDSGPFIATAATLLCANQARVAKWSQSSQMLFSKWLEVGNLADQLKN